MTRPLRTPPLEDVRQLRRDLHALSDTDLRKRYAKVTRRLVGEVRPLLARFHDWRQVAIDVIVHHESTRP